ncbi:MAG: SsrA-binding protein SmpB [Armatimonadota bacterium]|nr:SsrA-binding protein SmpB [Armatimonadota bacterium]
MAKRSDDGIKVIATNRKAYHDFHIEDTLEAGIVLTGSEVKSVAAGKVSLAEAYCQVENGEMWVRNMHIAPYESAGYAQHEPRRKRKLLLHKWEIERWRAKSEQKGYTIIPLRLYFRRGKAKLEIGLVRGKRQYDKREAIKRRDIEREMRRELHGRF